MRNANTWVRSVLGLGAVLLVAGPGMVLAVFDPSYTPRSLVVNGPGALTLAQDNVQYTAFVTFTNGETATLTGPPVVFTTTNAAVISVDPDGTVDTNGTGLAAVRGTLTQQGKLVSGSRLVRVSP